MLLNGIFAAITTPFYPDGKIYFRKIEHNVDRYSRTPISGIAVLGSTGEAIMLSDQERREVLREARNTAASHTVLLAGTSAESAIATLELTEYAASLSYDAALLRPPHYYKPQMKPENILAFYRFVADRSPLPVVIYNSPVFTGYDMPVEIVAELAEHPRIIGIKESGGSLEKIERLVESTRHVQYEVPVTEVFTAVTARMLAEANSEKAENVVPVESLAGSTATAIAAKPKLKTRTKNAGFQVLCGSAHHALHAFEKGAAGALIAFACIAPTACFEVYTAWKDRDPKLAEEKQQRIAAASQRIVGQLGVPGIKYGLDLNGYYGGPPRLPLLPVTADVKQEVEKLLADVRN
ncbi:MAG TPA: dihydrodipicolinate synthase family protein [Terriglobales bacterium]|nr:dihydrodipicolinate synthase family protein [Terriglobales bacterium]